MENLILIRKIKKIIDKFGSEEFFTDGKMNHDRIEYFHKLILKYDDTFDIENVEQFIKSIT